MEERKQIIVFAKGTLNDATKAELAANGYLAIESDQPHDVVTVLPLAGLVSHVAADDVVKALIDTCLSNDQRYKDFGKRILDSIKARSQP